MFTERMEYIDLLLDAQAAFKLVTFFKQLGVDYVFDVTLSRDLALMERLVCEQLFVPQLHFVPF